MYFSVAIWWLFNSNGSFYFNVGKLRGFTSSVYEFNANLFWILFLALWAIVPLMIIKGRVEEEPKIQTAQKVKSKKKGWFN